MPEFQVEGQDYVIQGGDNPFKLARQLLGRDASEQQVAAFAQQQGWTQESFRSGRTIEIRGTYVSEEARPSSAYMAAVRGEGEAYRAGEWNPITGAGPNPNMGEGVFGTSQSGAGDGTVPQYTPLSSILGGGQQQAPTPGSGVKSMVADNPFDQPAFSPGVSRAGQIQGGPIADIGGNAARFGGPNTRPVYTPPQMSAQQTRLFNQIEAGLPTGAAPPQPGARPGSPLLNQTLAQINPQREGTAPYAPTFRPPSPTGEVKGARESLGQTNNISAINAQGARLTGIALQESLNAAAFAAQNPSVDGEALVGQYLPTYVTEQTRQQLNQDPDLGTSFTPSDMAQMGYVQTSGNAWVLSPDAIAALGLPPSGGPTISGDPDAQGTAIGGGSSYDIPWWNEPVTGTYWDYNRPRRGGVGPTGSPIFSAPPPAAPTSSFGGIIRIGWNIGF